MAGGVLMNRTPNTWALILEFWQRGVHAITLMAGAWSGDLDEMLGRPGILIMLTGRTNRRKMSYPVTATQRECTWCKRIPHPLGLELSVRPLRGLAAMRSQRHLTGSQFLSMATCKRSHLARLQRILAWTGASAGRESILAISYSVVRRPLTPEATGAR